MDRQRKVDLEQRFDVVFARLAYLDAVRERSTGRHRHLPDSQRLLVAEPEPEPRIDQLDVVRRHYRAVATPSSFDPLRGSCGIEVAHDLGFFDRMAGSFDP
jgi:hypothetical protein